MSEWVDREDGEDFVKWIPLFVPLLALMIVVLVYVIGAEVL